MKKRTIKKRTGKHQEVTEIVTVHEDNKEPETTVTVVESEIPFEEMIEEFNRHNIDTQKDTRHLKKLGLKNIGVEQGKHKNTFCYEVTKDIIVIKKKFHWNN